MATPIVAGLAGLMKSYSPTSTNADIRNAIEANCNNVGTWVAKGRVNGFSAINALIVPFIVNAKANTLSIYKAGTFTQGTSLTGTAANLTNTDNKVVTVKSVLQSGVGYVASIQTDLPVNVTTTIRSANLQFSAKAPSGVTLQVFVKKNGAYTLLKSYPGTGSLTSYDLPISSPTSYFSNNTFSVVVRGYVALGRTPTSYTTTLDMLQLHMLVNPS